MDVHLRVEDTGIWLNDLDGTVEGLLGVEGVALSNDGSQIQAKLLRVHVGLEYVWECLTFASWDLDAILLAGQVAHNSST